MINKLCQYVNSAWFSERLTFFSLVLSPFSLLFLWFVKLRQFLYKKGVLKSEGFPVPIVIVGNLTVGGSGKTPLVITLCGLFKSVGYSPAVISRGYGGTYKNLAWVCSDSNPAEVGDEPVLIAARCDVPVVVARKRVDAVKAVLNDTSCNIIISDDGLQHYALQRDVEIAVVNDKRGGGNSLCLPAGPLREPKSRLNSVDLVIHNGGDAQNSYYLTSFSLVNINSPAKTLSLSCLENKKIHAVAGIGFPANFFDYLEGLGANLIKHPYPDHYFYCKDDFSFANDAMVVMTEKDAVKCRGIAGDNFWFLPVEAVLPEGWRDDLLHLLSTKK